MKHSKVIKKIVNVAKVLTVFKPAIEWVKWNIWLWNTHPHISIWVIGLELSLLLTFICWYVDTVYFTPTQKKKK